MTGMFCEGFFHSDPLLYLDYCVWIIGLLLIDPNMAHYKISNWVGHLLIFFNLLVFDRIHYAHVFKQDVQDFQQKSRLTT